MEPANSTKRSSGSWGDPESTDVDLNLEFPEGELFRSLPPEVHLDEVIRRSRELREWFPEGIPTAEERWKAKRSGEFAL